MNQHLDNLDRYTEDDFEDIVYYNPRKAYYEEETKYYPFVYEDSEGEKEILCTVNVCWRVVPPDYKSWDSPEDYYGYTELVAWDVVAVEDSEGEPVDVEKVLTPEQLHRYNSEIDAFVDN